jgi:hypothetical protein
MEFAAYTSPIVLADLFGIAALALAGGPGVARFIGQSNRGDVVGGDIRRPAASSRVVVSAKAAEK